MKAKLYDRNNTLFDSMKIPNTPLFIDIPIVIHSVPPAIDPNFHDELIDRWTIVCFNLRFTFDDIAVYRESE